MAPGEPRRAAPGCPRTERADGRRGHEVDTRGSNNSASTLRTTSNPQDVYSESLLGKLVLTPTARDTIKFTAETVQRRVSTDVLSAISPPTTLGLTTYDRLERNRFSVDYDFHDDAFHPAEGFVGTEDTLGRIVFGVTS